MLDIHRIQRVFIVLFASLLFRSDSPVEVQLPTSINEKGGVTKSRNWSGLHSGAHQ